MPNSLKCKIKHLCHNGTLTERERDRILEALEQEPIIDKIRAEINSPNRGTCDYFIVDSIEEIIKKYKAESEEGESE